MLDADFKQLNGPLGREVEAEGLRYLYFGGTAYLGIPSNNAFLKLYMEGIERYGLNNGTSRNNNVQLDIYEEAEKYAASQFGFPASLITSSGFLAAQMVMKQLSGSGELRYSPATHPALWLYDKPSVDSSFEDWSEIIVAEINSSPKSEWVLVSNTIDNLHPKIFDFSFLNKIHTEKNVVMVLDDSHGLGLIDIRSVKTQLKTNIEVVVVASMAKALGVDAGIIFGNDKIISEIKGSQSFLGASPPGAAGLYAFMHGSEIYRAALEKLQQSCLLLAKQLEHRPDWQFVPNFPVFLCKNADISSRLLRKQILVSSFPYPDKDSAPINRIVLCSWHSAADLQKLIKVLTEL